MAPISPKDGPVAVTGASGYIGSHLVKNLVEHGYTVRCAAPVAANSGAGQDPPHPGLVIK
jgi:uncharacterized protein YbjT (DUF2867 family)